MSAAGWHRLTPEEGAAIRAWRARKADFRRRFEAASDPLAPGWGERMDELIALMHENRDWYIECARNPRR